MPKSASHSKAGSAVGSTKSSIGKPHQARAVGRCKAAKYDAIVLLDTQPLFAYSPLPPGIVPTAVIDHHRPGRGRKPKCDFCDIRTDVGATTSIIFSYFMELDAPITPDLAAILLYAIESDLAGAAGQPGELDNIALSSLTLKADTSKLYRMRYVDLPQSYYAAYAAGLSSATLLRQRARRVPRPNRFPGKTGGHRRLPFPLRSGRTGRCRAASDESATLVMSLRTSDAKLSAGELMRRLTPRHR